MDPALSSVGRPDSPVPRKCFVSCGNVDRFQLLSDALYSLGFVPTSARDVGLGTLSPIEVLETMIRGTDVFIAALEGSGQDQNVLFELGMARGLSKRTVVLAELSSNLPFDLQGLLVVWLDWNRETAVKQALQRALELPGPRATTLATASFTSRPLGPAASLFMERFRGVGSGPRAGGDLVELVASMFTATGAVVEIGSTKGPDLAIWMAELESAMGNPLIVEVKHTLRDPVRTVNQVAAYVVKANTQWGLLLYLEGTLAGYMSQPRIPNVLISGIYSLLDDLRTASSAELVLQLRHAAVHGTSA